MSEWIRVTDRLPPPCTLVWVAGTPDGPFGWFVGRTHCYMAQSIFTRNGGRAWVDEYGGGVRGTVTHWMPLPEAPK